MWNISQDTYVSYMVIPKWELFWQKWISQKLRARARYREPEALGRQKKAKEWTVFFRYISLNIFLSETMISYEEVHFQSAGILRFINNIYNLNKNKFSLKIYF